jgi:hypothetical protein
MALVRVAAVLALCSGACSSRTLRGPAAPVDVYALRNQVLNSEVVRKKVAATCSSKLKVAKSADCAERVGDAVFCQLLDRTHHELAVEHCGADAAPTTRASPSAEASAAPVEQAPAPEQAPKAKGAFATMKAKITSSKDFRDQVDNMSVGLGCNVVKKEGNCDAYVKDAAFCLAFAGRMTEFQRADLASAKGEAEYCKTIDQKLPALSMLQGSKGPAPSFLQVSSHAPEDDLAKEMTHDLEMNFNKIAPFGKEDTAKELQDHAADTQDTLVDAVENAEVAEIKRAVFRALTRLRAATIKEFDTIARLETQAIDAYNDAHHYRAENPLAHLHEDEAPVEADKLKSFH